MNGISPRGGASLRCARAGMGAAGMTAGEWLALGCEQWLLGTGLLAGAAAVPWCDHPANRLGQGFHHYLGRLPPGDGRPCVWVHAVSLGETLAALALVRALRPADLAVRLTTTHPDVVSTALRNPGLDAVAFFPLDLLWAHRRALRRWRPRLALLFETDFWPGFSFLCRRARVPLVLVNGRISAKIYGFYRRWPALARLVFGGFARLLVQSPLDRERLLDLGADDARIRVVGNLKADIAAPASSPAVAAVRAWVGAGPLLVLGSLHPGEFDGLLPVLPDLLALSPGLRILIAPRAIERAPEWRQRLAGAGIAAGLRSALAGGGADGNRALPGDGEGAPAGGGGAVPAGATLAARAAGGAAGVVSARVLLLDTLGELASLYRLATFAFVGGSLVDHVGGHNPLEPLLAGAPLVMGPHTRNFADLTGELNAAAGMVVIDGFPGLVAIIRGWLADPAGRVATVGAARGILARHRGALGRTLAELQPLLAADSAGFSGGDVV